MNIEHSQDNTPPEDEYYHNQIVGLQVITTYGERISNVTDIFSGTSNDNYIFRSSSGEILIPAIEDVIQSIDLDQGIITIKAINGLLNLNEKS